MTTRVPTGIGMPPRGGGVLIVTGPRVTFTSGIGRSTVALSPAGVLLAFQTSPAFRKVADGVPSDTIASGSLVKAPAASVRQPQRTEP